MRPAIDLIELQKRFGGVTALDGVTLQVPAGAIYGLLGVNGAGKTTLLRLLLGFLRPSGGGGTLLGRPLGQLPAAERARLAYVPEQPRLYDTLSVERLLAFVRGLHPRWDEAAAQRYVELFQLPLRRRVRDLSTGMRSQLALAVALAGQRWRRRPERRRRCRRCPACAACGPRATASWSPAGSSQRRCGRCRASPPCRPLTSRSRTSSGATWKSDRLAVPGRLVSCVFCGSQRSHGNK